jgi:hypothetical protein
VYILIIITYRAEVDGTESCEIKYKYKRFKFFLEEAGGVKPLLIIYINQKDKCVHKEKDYINIKCAMHRIPLNSKCLVISFLETNRARRR